MSKRNKKREKKFVLLSSATKVKFRLSIMVTVKICTSREKGNEKRDVHEEERTIREKENFRSDVITR